MKLSVNLPLTKNADVPFKVGNVIDKDSSLFLGDDKIHEEIIPLAKILKVKSKDLSKYLVKDVGANVSEGEFIARRKGIISTVQVKSPISGKIANIDLENGTISIIRGGQSKNALLVPHGSTVKKIGEDYLEVEVNGIKFDTEKGYGNETIGMLMDLTTIQNSPYEFDCDVDSRVILMVSAGKGVLAKLDALGAAAVITHKDISQSHKIASVSVTGKTYESLGKYVGKRVWVRPVAKEIIILS